MTKMEIAAIPACAPSECFDSPTFEEAVYFARLELDLIDEGQEAAECYTKREVARLRKFVKDNRASLASFAGKESGSMLD